MADLLASFGTALMLLSASYPFVPAKPEIGREVSVESLTGSADDRDIRLSLITATLRRKPLAAGLDLHLALTAAHAGGRLRRLEGSWEAGTLREVTVASPGNGLGLGVEARYALVDRGRLRLNLQGGWTAIAFDRRFPAGGTWYNGLARAGLAVSGRLDGGGEIGLGWRWAHVSNGRGVVARNPGLDARGWWLTLVLPF